MKYTTIILFLHILSAIIWIGGMIAIRVAVHPVLQQFEDAKMRLGTTLKIVGRLFNLVIPFILILLASALYFEIAMKINNPLTHTKEAIWTIMTLNFIYMYVKRAKAYKLFLNGEAINARNMVAIIPKVLLPINIFLGIASVMLGVILSGF